MTPTRRGFLGGVLATGALLSTGAAAAAHASGPARALIDLSRDRTGRPHIERASVVDAEGVHGTLPVFTKERDALLQTLTSGDYTALQRRGFRIDGRKFVYIKSDDEGTAIHAVRPGEFVTVRAVEGALVIATSSSRMVHGRAVDAVRRFCHGADRAAPKLG